VGVEHGVHVLEEGDDVDCRWLELTNPLANGDVALFEGQVLLADDEIGVVAVVMGRMTSKMGAISSP